MIASYREREREREIKSERAVRGTGSRLSAFVARLPNLSGDQSDAVGKAACALSKFSCDELETVFSSHGELLPLVAGELTRRTRSKMIIPVPEEYASFACDALAYTLPMIADRRQRIGIPNCLRSAAISDLMFTIPKAAAWSPLQGQLSTPDTALLSCARGRAAGPGAPTTSTRTCRCSLFSLHRIRAAAIRTSRKADFRIQCYGIQPPMAQCPKENV